MPSGAVNNVNMQPDGTTTFAEIDLPAGDSTTPANNSRIRWVRLADGSVVAEAYAYDSSGLGQGALDIKAHGRGPGGSTGRIILTSDHTSGRSAQVLVQAGSGDADPNQSKVWARAQGRSGFSDQLVTMIDGLGASSFVRTVGALRGAFPAFPGTISSVLTIPGDSTVTRSIGVIFGGTCFSTTGGNMALDLRTDGNGTQGSGTYRDNAVIFGNSANFGYTVFGVSIFPLSGGNHQFQLEASTGFAATRTDTNSYGQLIAFSLD